MSLKRNWQTKIYYCYQCGCVMEQDDLHQIEITPNRQYELFCNECYIPPPKHIPFQQKERWYRAKRKKYIQSDGKKRRRQEMG
jgi:hypothetical protein